MCCLYRVEVCHTNRFVATHISGFAFIVRYIKLHTICLHWECSWPFNAYGDISCSSEISRLRGLPTGFACFIPVCRSNVSNNSFWPISRLSSAFQWSLIPKIGSSCKGWSWVPCKLHILFTTYHAVVRDVQVIHNYRRKVLFHHLVAYILSVAIFSWLFVFQINLVIKCDYSRLSSDSESVI